MPEILAIARLKLAVPATAIYSSDLKLIDEFLHADTLQGFKRILAYVGLFSEGPATP